MKLQLSSIVPIAVVLAGAFLIVGGALSVENAIWPLGSYQPKAGDVIFQSFPHEALTDMIEHCTHSPISHCGVVLNEDGDWVVIEAVGPVKETPLIQWVARGRSGGFLVERMDLTSDEEVALKEKLRFYLGKPYDFRFEMSDKAIYCSELVYKGFKGATGQELGHLQRLGDLDWHDYEVLIRQLSGDGSLPLDRLLITPLSLSQAGQLHEVYRRNW